MEEFFSVLFLDTVHVDGDIILIFEFYYLIQRYQKLNALEI